MKTETITCDICKKKMEKSTLVITVNARTNDPTKQVLDGTVQFDVCETCFAKLGFTREDAARGNIEDLIYDIATDAVADSHQ